MEKTPREQRLHSRGLKSELESAGALGCGFHMWWG